MTMREAGEVLILGNPFSGAAKNADRVQRLADALQQRGVSARVMWDRAEWTRLLSDEGFCRTCRCVVAAGGDGTVAEVLSHHPLPPLAVLPLGTENLFARCHRFCRSPERLAERILCGTPRATDLGLAGEREFSLLATAGFDAEVVRRVHRWRTAGRGMRRLSYASYMRPMLTAIRRYGFPVVELEADGCCVRGVQVFVFNAPVYSLRLRLAPDARTDDGLLDWVVVERGGFGHLLWTAIRMSLRRGGVVPGVLRGCAREIRLRSDVPVPVEVDGDPAGFTPLQITVRPSAVRVMG